jgi:dephospho-CoA kinase
MMGYPTYDCDSMAKWLMNNNEQLKAKLIALLGNDAYDVNRCLNRSYVASRIFANDELRLRMNDIVHPAVKDNLHDWLETLDAPIAFVETALPSESGLGGEAQALWVVDAPVEVRVQRVMKRSAMSHSEVLDRIASQAKEFDFDGAVHILNDNDHSLIEQVTQALQSLM